MDVSELIERIRKAALGEKAGTVPSLAPVYLLVGEETLLRERALSALRMLNADDGLGPLNQDVFHAKDTHPEDIVRAARTLPMFAAQRLILVREAEHFSAQALELFLPLLEQPVGTTCLVITAEKLDGRTRFARLAKKSGSWVDVQPLGGRALINFVATEGQRRGHLVTSSDAQLLVDTLGSDLLTLDDALERLSLYVGEGAPITRTAIESVVVHLPLATIWDLVDGVSSTDVERAMAALESLLDLAEPPLRIVAMLARQFRILVRMKDALRSESDPQSAARRAGAPPFKALELAKASRSLDVSQLRSAFIELANLDRSLKSSRCPAEVLMQQAVLRLSQKAAHAASI